MLGAALYVLNFTDRGEIPKRGGLMKTLKRHLWVGAIALGLLFVGLGALFVVTGLDAKDMIRTLSLMRT